MDYILLRPMLIIDIVIKLCAHWHIYMRNIIVHGTGSAADKLRTLHSLTKDYKFDADNFHFIKDA